METRSEKEIKRLEELIARLDKKSMSNYYNYQQSGIQRYMREHENAEELAGYLRRVLSGADDHQKMVEYRLALVDFCARAIKCKNDDNHADMYGLIKSLALYGITSLSLADPWGPYGKGAE